MRIAITGSSGMIGLALTNYLISKKIEVIMFIRENCTKLDLIPDSKLIHVVKCDLANLYKLEISLTCDYFIHMGWDKTIGIGRDDVYLQNNNVKYTLDACFLAKKMGAKKFVGIGSQAEYGLHNEDLSIDTVCTPITGYGIAKFCAGQFSKILCTKLEINFNWIRVLSVYGTNDNPNTLISYVTRCLKDGITPNVSECQQIWDYISCDEAAKIIYKITRYGDNGISYPLGSGKGRVLKEYLEELRLKINPFIEINYGAIPYQKNQVMHLVANMDYLKKLKNNA